MNFLSYSIPFMLTHFCLGFVLSLLSFFFYFLGCTSPDGRCSISCSYLLSLPLLICTSILKNQVGKIKFDELQKSISKLIFAGYTGSKNQVRNRLKIKFVELDFSKLIFQKSSTDQQGDSHLANKFWQSYKFANFQSGGFTIDLWNCPSVQLCHVM